MGAILTAGHAADGAFWYDDRTGTWMSSTYYADKLPVWLMDLNAMLMPGQYLNQSWTTLMDPLLYPGCQADSNGLELGLNNQTWFPYDLKALSTTGKLLNVIEGLLCSAPDPFCR